MLFHRHRDDETLVEVTTSPGRAAVVVATVIGGASIVVGFYALIRAGLNTHDLSRPTVTVLNIEHTPLLALSEVSFGAVMILAAMTPRFGRVAIGLLSATLAAFGAALLSAPSTSRLHHWFGVVDHQGWPLVIVGAIGLLATLAFPTVTRRTIVRSAPAAAAITSSPDVEMSAPVPPNVSPIADAAHSADRSESHEGRHPHAAASR
jgi:hypothetical protein